MGHGGRVAALSLALLGIAAGPAHALTAKVDGHDVVIDGDIEANDLRVTQVGSTFRIVDLDGGESARAGCSEPSSGTVSCPAAGITRLVVTLGLGNDRALIDSSVGSVRAVIDGEGGFDVIAGGPGNDTLRGGLGGDLLEGSNIAAFQNEPATGGAGDDDLSGGAGNDDLKGGKGDDKLRGDDGDNFLDGGDGDDELFGSTLGGRSRLHGGPGDDRFRDSDGGGDTFFGEEGARDIADYSQATASVQVSVGSSGGANDLAAGGKTDDIRDADVVLGGPFVDFLTGSTKGDELQGLGGADILNGFGGDDTLIGGAGADTLNGGAGTDVASYADHAAPVSARTTADHVSGNTADGPPGARDTMTGVEALEGTTGGDSLTGDDGPNQLGGGPGADVLQGAGGADRLDGGTGTDLLDGGAQGDTFENGTVTYATRTQPVIVTVGDGAKDGNDLFDANPDGRLDSVGASVEGVIGTPFDDSIDGGLGPGGGDRSVTAGGPGPLRISGLAGADVLSGGDGDDTILGGSGPDVIGGGAGVDTADYSDHPGRVTISLDGVANDGDDLDGNGESNSGEEGDRITDTVEGLRGGGGPDKIRGNAGDNDLEGGPGADKIKGKGGADAIDGGANEDTLLGQNGDDRIDAIDGEPDRVDCGAGDDEIAADLADGTFGAVPPTNFAGCEALRQAPKDQFPVVRIAGRARLRNELLQARLRCPRALRHACHGRLEASGPRGRHRALGHRRYRIRPGHARGVAVRLTRREAAGLRRTHRVRLLASETGPDGQPKLTLRPVRVLVAHRRTHRHH